MTTYKLGEITGGYVIETDDFPANIPALAEESKGQWFIECPIDGEDKYRNFLIVKSEETAIRILELLMELLDARELVSMGEQWHRENQATD